eukprot:357678-Chlamydomonas_euryale.AAC.5
MVAALAVSRILTTAAATVHVRIHAHRPAVRGWAAPPASRAAQAAYSAAPAAAAAAAAPAAAAAVTLASVDRQRLAKAHKRLQGRPLHMRALKQAGDSDDRMAAPGGGGGVLGGKSGAGSRLSAELVEGGPRPPAGSVEEAGEGEEQEIDVLARRVVELEAAAVDAHVLAQKMNKEGRFEGEQHSQKEGVRGRRRERRGRSCTLNGARWLGGHHNVVREAHSSFHHPHPHH